MMIIIFVIILTLVAVTSAWSDVDHYWVNTNDILVDGRMPYSDSVFEYPPLTLLFFMIPRLVSPSLEVYHYVFAVFADLFVLVILYFGYRIGDMYSVDRRYVFVMIAAMTLGAHYLISCRYDVIPAAFTVMGLYLYLSSRYSLAFLIMAVATMIKLYPALILLAMLIPFLLRKDWRMLFMGVLVSLAVCVLSELPFLIDNYQTAFAYLGYHSDRGIQVESLAASFLFLYNVLVPGSVTIGFSFGSHNLEGPAADALVPFMNYILIASILAIIVFTVLRLHRSGNKDNLFGIVCITAELLLMAFVIFGKVYSAQYMIWIIAIIPAIYCSITVSEERRTLYCWTLCFAVVSGLALTYYRYVGFEEHYAGFVIVEIVKNIVHLLLMGFLFRLLMKLTSDVKKDSGLIEECESDT